MTKINSIQDGIGELALQAKQRSGVYFDLVTSILAQIVLANKMEQNSVSTEVILEILDDSLHKIVGLNTRLKQE